MSKSLSDVVHCHQVKSNIKTNLLSTSFQIEVKSLLVAPNNLDKNKEISVLILSFRRHVNKKKYLIKQLYQLFKVFLKVITVQSLLMGKLVQEKHILWRVVKQSNNKEVSFQEHLIMLLNQLKVNILFILGTPGVNFMVQVSML